MKKKEIILRDANNAESAMLDTLSLELRSAMNIGKIQGYALSIATDKAYLCTADTTVEHMAYGTMLLQSLIVETT